jgi:hypothetical protein
MIIPTCNDGRIEYVFPPRATAKAGRRAFQTR